MDKKPLLTVITVVYNLIDANREKYFIQCLESVHNQSYKNIEHIVVDGASDDGTLELLKKYAEKGWIKYISEPDESIYEAMNKGAHLAQGQYIAFLNSDDFYSNLEGIEKCIERLKKTNADCSYAKIKMIDENGQNPFKHHFFMTPDITVVFTSMPFSHQSMIVKTDVFKKLGLYDLSYKSASDYDFLLRMFLNKCSFVYCNLTLATFRIGGFSYQDNNISISEVATFYQKYYSKYSYISIETAENIFRHKVLSIKMIYNLLPYFDSWHKIKFICYQLIVSLKPIRRCFLQFRFNGHEKLLRILGKRII